MSETKQVIIIRKDLNMRKGKIAAQASHASWAPLLNRGHIHQGTNVLSIPLDDDMLDWFKVRFTKICCYVESEQALIDIYETARAKGLPCALIRDAGLTEFGGVPTYTAVGIGPASSDKIDPITGRLPLSLIPRVHTFSTKQSSLSGLSLNSPIKPAVAEKVSDNSDGSKNKERGPGQA